MVTTDSSVIGSEQAYLDRLQDVTVQPVFIVGPHRSGTTLLYRVLEATGRFNAVTLFHILNRHRLLQLHFGGRLKAAWEELDRDFEARGVKGEDQNSAKVSPDILEEYCYSFDYQGRRPILDEKNLPGFRQFCQKLQLLQEPGRPLLLKNPFDTPNFLPMQRMLPQARFVFIYRHPAAVINSQMRMLRYEFEKRREYEAILIPRFERLYRSPMKLALARFIYSERFPLLFQQVSRNVSRSFDYVTENIDKLGPAAMGVTYTELCQNTNPVVRRILDFLGLDPELSRDFSTMVRSREAPLLPEVQHHYAWIEKRNAAYLRRFQPRS